ncbi:uncharacterized protein BDV14DRAFT_168489 [Aspergillus stella-maris]|uniref:uncharacterized protein n=1 Tax=Aspergillus stella-maris TaxID=1810926 RepID=UPI003CCD47C7
MVQISALPDLLTTSFGLSPRFLICSSDCCIVARVACIAWLVIFKMDRTFKHVLFFHAASSAHFVAGRAVVDHCCSKISNLERSGVLVVGLNEGEERVEEYLVRLIFAVFDLRVS